MDKKKVLLVLSENLMGGASTITPSTLSIVNPSAGIKISSSTTPLSSISILITNEYISKLEIWHTKLGDWMILISF